ncbi:MAG TPA: AAA family ATPase, partial [Caldilineaceae bacterium]|nr:AAA family ATPase [Caldilineaceae bacterium]
VELPHWRRQLVQLDLGQFEAVLQAPVVEAAGDGTSPALREEPAPYIVATPEARVQPPDGAAATTRAVLATADLSRGTLATLSNRLGYNEEIVARWLRALERKGQAIFTGPPGVGKTFAARLLARYLADDSDGFWELVQFHAAYSYEDFIQGLRPKANAAGQLDYTVEPGHFLDFCRRAAQRRGRCVLVIDEINRANVARVFGELLYLLEYREDAIRLAGGQAPFRIPANVRLIGTLNSADRSIALFDFALRRRFAFIELAPNPNQLRLLPPQQRPFSIEALIKLVERVNKAIDDPAFAVGYTYFLRTDLTDSLPEIWESEIEPYLAEYFFNQPDRVAEFRWSQVCADFEAATTTE